MTAATPIEADPAFAFLPAWARLTRTQVNLLLIALSTRVAMILVAVLAAAYFPYVIDGWDRGPSFIRYFARWDSGFYMDIAELGYGFKPEGWAFTPGYPLVLGTLWRMIPGIDLPTAGFIVSNLSFFGGVLVFHKLTTKLFDENLAWRASVLVAVFPGSFYFSAVYADALFFLLVVAAFLWMVERRWLLAGLAVSYAGITRPPGMVMIGALGLAVLIQAYRERRFDLGSWASLPVALALPVAFHLYAGYVTGDPFISEHVREVYWPNVQWHDPSNLFDLAGVDTATRALVYGGMAIVALTMVYCVGDGLVKRRVDAWPAYAFALVMGIVYLAYSEPNPIVRYLVSFIPMYWMFAAMSASRGVFIGLVVGFSCVGAFVAAVFATWGHLY